MPRRPSVVGQAPTDGSGRPLLRVHAMIAVLAAATVGLLAVAPSVDGDLLGPGPWPLVVLAGFVAAEILVVHLPFRRQVHTFSMSEVVLLLGLVTLTATELAVAHGVAAVLAIGLHRRRGVVKTLFNVFLFASTSLVAFHVLHGLVAGAEVMSATFILAAMGAVIASSLLQAGMVSGVIWLSGDEVRPEALREAALFALASATVNTSLGLVVLGLLTDGRALTSWLVVPPGVTVLVAYVIHTRGRRDKTTIDTIYQASRQLVRAEGLDDVVAGLLPIVRQNLRATRVELTLFADAELEGHRAVCDEGATSTLQEYDRSGRGEEGLRHALELRGTLLAGAVQPDAELAAYAAGRGWRDAVAVPLVGAHRTFGAIVAADRLGELQTFARDDADLLTALAGSLATLLERRRLGESLDEVVRLQEELNGLVRRDPLTGLPHRAAFVDAVDQVVAEDRPSAMVVLELQGVGDVNAAHGTAVGDQVIATFASHLQDALRPRDVAGRIGGSRFAVMVGDADDVDSVHELAVSLRRRARRPLDLELPEIGPIVLRGDVGVCVDLLGEHGATQLLARAEAAARSARASAGSAGAYVTFSDEQREGSRRLLDLTAALHDATQSGVGLGVAYQPIVDIAAGNVIGVEALARWSHPEFGVVPPAEFLPIAEHHGWMAQVGDALITQALRDARQWQQGGRPVGLTVNLSPSQLRWADLVTVVDGRLREAGLSPKLLTVDLNADQLTGDEPGLAVTVDRLRGLGVQVALDDIEGTARNLHLVDAIRFDVMKLGRGLTSHMATSGVARGLVTSLVDFGHDRHVPVLAEGVEGDEQLAAIRQVGADRAQGHLIASPMGAVAVDALLRGLARVAPDEPTNIIHLSDRSA